MPYYRDEVVAAVTDYYHFLTSLHVDPVDIKTPPSSGWPGVTSQTCNKLSKTDAVILLLKHIPYITNEDNFHPTLVWWLSRQRLHLRRIPNGPYWNPTKC
jgi:hypothetical protein